MKYEDDEWVMTAIAYIDDRVMETVVYHKKCSTGDWKTYHLTNKSPFRCFNCQDSYPPFLAFYILTHLLTEPYAMNS